MNRLGFTLKKVLKVKPLRKIPETDAIFKNVGKRHQEAREDSGILRISIDTKAKVKVGNLSRGGYSRMRFAPRAADHDQQWDATLIPLGIYELNSQQVMMLFGNSLETTDFIVDGLEMWWNLRREELDHPRDCGDATPYGTLIQNQRYPAADKSFTDLKGWGGLR